MQRVIVAYTNVEHSHMQAVVQSSKAFGYKPLKYTQHCASNGAALMHTCCTLCTFVHNAHAVFNIFCLSQSLREQRLDYVCPFVILLYVKALLVRS
jgi:hypothetical protein